MLLTPSWTSAQPLQSPVQLLPEGMWYERRHLVPEAGVEDHPVPLAVHVQVVAPVAIGLPLPLDVGLSLELGQIRAPVSPLPPLASGLGGAVRGSHPLL